MTFDELTERVKSTFGSVGSTIAEVYTDSVKYFTEKGPSAVTEEQVSLLSDWTEQAKRLGHEIPESDHLPVAKTVVLEVTEAQYQEMRVELKAIEDRVAIKVKMKDQAFTRWCLDVAGDLEKARIILNQLNPDTKDAFWPWLYEHTGYSKSWGRTLFSLRESLKGINDVPAIGASQAQFLEQCPPEYIKDVVTGALTYEGFKFDEMKVRSKDPTQPTLAKWMAELRAQSALEKETKAKQAQLQAPHDPGNPTSAAERALKRNEHIPEDEQVLVDQDPEDTDDRPERIKHARPASAINKVDPASMLLREFATFKKLWNLKKSDLIDNFSLGKVPEDLYEELRGLELVCREVSQVLKTRLS
jgi:hypothetical protein